MSFPKTTTLPIIQLPPTAEYSVSRLPRPTKEYTFEHTPPTPDCQNGKISIKHKGIERFWALIVEDNQVAPAGNLEQICSVHDYVTRIMKVITMSPSPRGRNLVNEFYRQKEGPVLRIANWTFTATDCYCIGCMLITLTCVAVTIGYLMTMPCPLL